jgi:hypothetical protein
MKTDWKETKTKTWWQSDGHASRMTDRRFSALVKKQAHFGISDPIWNQIFRRIKAQCVNDTNEN